GRHGSCTAAVHGGHAPYPQGTRSVARRPTAGEASPGRSPRGAGAGALGPPGPQPPRRRPWPGPRVVGAGAPPAGPDVPAGPPAPPPSPPPCAHAASPPRPAGPASRRHAARGRRGAAGGGEPRQGVPASPSALALASGEAGGRATPSAVHAPPLGCTHRASQTPTERLARCRRGRGVGQAAGVGAARALRAPPGCHGPGAASAPPHGTTRQGEPRGEGRACAPRLATVRARRAALEARTRLCSPQAPPGERVLAHAGYAGQARPHGRQNPLALFGPVMPLLSEN